MGSEIHQVIFSVPGTSADPVAIDIKHTGLRMVLLRPEAVDSLASEWKVPGVYFLIGPSRSPDRFRAYVGKVGTGSLVSRLKTHKSKKKWWTKALLVASTSDELNSAELGRLESRLFDILNNAYAAEVENVVRPRDETLSANEQSALERYLAPITAALRAIGAVPDTADQQPAAKHGKRRHYSESVLDLINADLLKPGTTLEALRGDLRSVASVRPNGSIAFDGKTYESVSAAATAASPNAAENGWAFWGAPSGTGNLVSLEFLRDRLRADQVSNAPGVAATANSSGVAGSDVEHQSARSKRPRPTRKAKGRRQRNQVTVHDLISHRLLNSGEYLRAKPDEVTERARLNANGTIRFAGVTYDSLSAAAAAAGPWKSVNGWEYWRVERAGALVVLSEIRARLG